MGAGIAVLLLAGAPALAQPAPPRIGYVYPAGAQQGTTYVAVVGGTGFDNVSQALIAGGGVKVTVLEHIKPINQGQAGMLRDRLMMLRQGAQDANALKEMGEIRHKLAVFAARPTSPALVETVLLQVVVAADAEPGERELRLVTPNGVTNPRAIQVGRFPEFSRKATVLVSDPNNFLGPRPINQPTGAVPPSPEMKVTLPAVVNGQVLPGGVERYRFQATKGQRLVAAASARELIPYLADAVPGWFQAVLVLYDANGREVAYDDDYRYHPDPVLFYEVPKDGEYVLAIRDSIYRGREDFVYRITIGELPFVTGVFPLGGPAGSQTPVELLGWNLPASRVTQDAREWAPGVHPLDLGKGKWSAGRAVFAVDDLPESAKKAPNNTLQTAQAVTLPVIVNGRIDQPGQWDIYRFEGKAGDEVVAEVMARRLGSPLDSSLKLTDASGKQLAFNDDCVDKGCGLETHHADSYLRAKLPASGTYFVHLGDVQRQAGPEFAYRLRISPPRPDFELIVSPSTVSVRPGTNVPLTVTALRKDGFDGAIDLGLTGAPLGFSLAGARVPSGASEVRVTLAGPLTPMADPVRLRVEGRSRLQGKDVVRQAAPAENMMQAFAYWHLVPASDLFVSVVGRFGGRGVVRVLSETPVRLQAGTPTRVRVNLPLSGPAGNFILELNDPPEGVSIQGVAPAGMGSEITLLADPAKVKPGTRGNLIFNLFVTFRPAPAPAATTRPGAGAIATTATRPAAGAAATGPSAATRPASAPALLVPQPLRKNPAGVLPAIPFEIVAGERSKP